MDDDIETKRLRLLTLDAEFLRASLAGERARAEGLLGARLPEDWPQEPDLLRMRLEQLESDEALVPWLTRAMELRSERRVVGVIGFHGPPGGDWLRELAPGGVEFGYTVESRWRRRGFALEASRGLMRWATLTHGVRTFVLSMSDQNEASVALALRLGFSRVGSWHHEQRGPEEVYRLDAPAGQG